MKSGREDELMGRGEIRGWIDADGSIISLPPPHSAAWISVVQKRREALDVFCKSVKRRYGVDCVLILPKGKRQFHEALIRGLREVATVIEDVEPFRAPERNAQVEKFRRDLQLPARRRRRIAEEALLLF